MLYGHWLSFVKNPLVITSHYVNSLVTSLPADMSVWQVKDNDVRILAGHPFMTIVLAMISNALSAMCKRSRMVTQQEERGV